MVEESYTILHGVLMDKVYKLFSENEAKLLLDALNGHCWRELATLPKPRKTVKEPRDPYYYRGSLYLSVSDHVDLNAADTTWQIQKQPMLQKVRRLSESLVVSIFIWADRMWENCQEEEYWEEELGRFSG